jgi:hypothetical protein
VDGTENIKKEVKKETGARVNGGRNNVGKLEEKEHIQKWKKE